METSSALGTLGKLPLELRHKVYACTTVGSYVLSQPSSQYMDPANESGSTGLNKATKERTVTHNIFVVSRAISAEATHIFYRWSLFTYRVKIHYYS